ncbi:MAG: NERD domain-containing protein [Clostridia bacterium]|nr:NERD domain-containing protein [Clostridia bacterium]
MESLIKTLITVSVITACLLVLFVVGVLIHYLRTRRMVEKLLKHSRRDGLFVYNLLRTSFPSGRLFRRISLPCRGSDGAIRRVPCDLLLVDRGGIFVIRVINMAGSVDNSDRYTWTVRNQNGMTEIPNPFEQNRQSLRAVEDILKSDGVYNIPRYNLVVFSGKRVGFRHRSDKLLTAEHLIETIRDMNRNRFLSAGEMAKAVGAIRRRLPSPQNQGARGTDTP